MENSGRDGGMMLTEEGEEQLLALPHAKDNNKKNNLLLLKFRTKRRHIGTEILRNSIFPKVAPSLAQSRLLVFHLQ